MRNLGVGLAALCLVFAPLGTGCAQILGIEETRLVEPEPEPEPDADDDGAGSSQDAGPAAADDDPVLEHDAGPAAAGEDFDCLGTQWLEEAEESRIEIVARIVEITSPITDPIFVEGMRVTVCQSRLDISCSGGEETFSNAEGVARVEVSKGFDGYLRIEGPDATGEERVGYLWYFSQPLRNTYVFPIFSMTPAFRDEVIYGAELGSGISRDPDRGEIAINVTDCSEADPPTQDVEGEEVLSAPGQNAPRVHFAISDEDLVDDATRQFYFSNGPPVWPRREDDQLTDATGLGGFLNVRPGTIPIEAVPQSLGRQSGTDTLLVRAGFLTTVRLLPQ